MNSDNEEEDTPVSNFLAGYCIILPNGKRYFPDCYSTYCKVILDSLEIESRGIMKKYYLEAAAIETNLEAMFGLKDEHLMGICEVYNDPKQRFATANFEASRLNQSREKLQSNEANQHLDLFLVTSLQVGQTPDSDIVRRLVTQRRSKCVCLLCLPGISLGSPFDDLDNEEELAMKWLKLKSLPTRVYIPFRHRRYRCTSHEPNTKGTAV